MGNKEYEILVCFWIWIFVIIFGIGVVMGIVMEFEFGINWVIYFCYVGDIFGSVLVVEGIFVFVLESGFFGIFLFGWNRVSLCVYFIVILGVWLGFMFLVVWIVVVNFWQQILVGYYIVGEGLNVWVEIIDFWVMVFNLLSVDCLFYVWVGVFLVGVFLVFSVYVYYIFKNWYVELLKCVFKIVLGIVIVLSLVQLVIGYSLVEGVVYNQFVKLVVMEGYFDMLVLVYMYVIGWVNKEE